MSIRIWEGDSTPPGATWDRLGLASPFSQPARQKSICLFDLSGMQELRWVGFPEYTEEVWHRYLPGVAPGTVYTYSVFRPYKPEAGHRFNPNKL
jgi:isoamylase